MTADHPQLDRDIAEHSAGRAERDRLASGPSRLEFVRTRELLARHLPPPPAGILDAGGAAGVYALPLAAEGYAVTLVDPVPLHVEQARAASAAQPDAPLAGVELGDARRLAQPDGWSPRRASRASPRPWTAWCATGSRTRPSSGSRNAT